MAEDKRVYACTALTGGASGALDALPYNSLQDGELAFTVTDDYIYVHVFDASSSSSESSPDVIAPDDIGSNTGRWLLRLSFLEPLYVDRTNGRVSIGTSTPPTVWTVNVGSVADSGVYIYGTNNPKVIIEDTDGGWPGIYFKNSGTVQGKIEINSTGAFYFYSESSYLFFFAGGSEVMRVSPSGKVAVGEDISPDRLLHVELSDATVSAVSYPFRITHVTTGTPAVGIGTGMEFEVETADGNNEVGATIEAVATDVTGGSEDFDLVFKLMTGGSAVAEKIRFTSDGKLGVGVSPDEAVHASGKGYFTEGVRVREDVDDYGGNFTNYTPPTGASALIILAADTNATNPGQRLYAYVNGSWRYVDLT